MSMEMGDQRSLWWSKTNMVMLWLRNKLLMWWWRSKTNMVDGQWYRTTAAFTSPITQTTQQTTASTLDNCRNTLPLQNCCFLPHTTAAQATTAPIEIFPSIYPKPPLQITTQKKNLNKHNLPQFQRNHNHCCRKHQIHELQLLETRASPPRPPTIATSSATFQTNSSTTYNHYRHHNRSKTMWWFVAVMEV